MPVLPALLCAIGVSVLAVALPPPAIGQTQGLAAADADRGTHGRLMLAQVSSPGPSANPLSALEKLGQSLLGAPEQDFLDPEQAFVLDASAPAPERIELRWDIAEGYYLYRKRFDVKLAGDSNLQGQPRSPGELQISKGKVKHDEYFGEVEVYYGGAHIKVPLTASVVAAAAQVNGALDLAVTYQGCADAGLCYPPITKQVALQLPPMSSGGGAVAAAVLPEQDRIAASLAGDSMALMMLSFFGFGLLLTFTPCVLPMIPILSGIVIGQGGDVSTAKAFRLSLVYVLAMAAAYTALGVAAGLSGAGLQAAFQDPWVLATFSLVFVLLALSMFGFYELQVPAFIQERLTRLSNTQRGGTDLGAAVMGLLSALIVGPCIAPPLAGALIYISQTGDALLGGAALFALSLGMGVPLLIVGTSAGRLMPHAGPWMDTVKAVFGVMLLAVAIYLMARVVPDWVTLVAWAILLMVTAIYLGALENVPTGASGWRRLWKGTGLVMLVYGVLLMVGASTGSGTLMRPLQGLALSNGAAQATDELPFRSVKGLTGFEAALRAASATGQPVMLDFYADWCVSCKEMEYLTFSDPAVRAALAGAVLVQADVTANDAEDKALLDRFGLFGPPAILFFGADGFERKQFRVVGYMPADDFIGVVQRAISPTAVTRVSAVSAGHAGS